MGPRDKPEDDGGSGKTGEQGYCAPLRKLTLIAKLSRSGGLHPALRSEVQEMSMREWRPWIIGISSLASGALLFLIGYFSLQFSEPIIPGLASRGLFLASFALLAVYATSGINKFVWSIRAGFNEVEFRRLKQLRTFGALITVPVVIGIVLPLVSSAFRTLRGEVHHDAVVMFSIALTAFGLILGGLVRAAEFRLLKLSSVRTSQIA